LGKGGIILEKPAKRTDSLYVSPSLVANELAGKDILYSKASTAGMYPGCMFE